jgi:hypothetical protein
MGAHRIFFLGDSKRICLNVYIYDNFYYFYLPLVAHMRLLHAGLLLTLFFDPEDGADMKH